MFKTENWFHKSNVAKSIDILNVRNGSVALAKLAMLKHGGLQTTAVVKCGRRIAMLFSLYGVFVCFFALFVEIFPSQYQRVQNIS